MPAWKLGTKLVADAPDHAVYGWALQNARAYVHFYGVTPEGEECWRWMVFIAAGKGGTGGDASSFEDCREKCYEDLCKLANKPFPEHYLSFRQDKGGG